MKRMQLIPLVLLLAALVGCAFPQFISETPVASSGEIEVVRTTIPSMYAPKVNGMPLGYDAAFQVMNRYLLSWEPGFDTYGMPTGFSDDRWTLSYVSIDLPEKAAIDTIFWPTRGGRPDPENAVYWFPGWTGPIEGLSGLPYPPVWVDGYPFDACPTTTIPDMSAQVGTIYGEGVTDRLSVTITCPKYSEAGGYALDVRGATPQQSNVIVYVFREPGVYSVVWESTESDAVEVFEFEVPVDWFCLHGAWEVDVGPWAQCLAWWWQR